MATKTTFKKAGNIWPSEGTTPDDTQKFTYTSLSCYGISKGFGQNKVPPIQTPIQKSVNTPREPFQLVAQKGNNEPSIFIIDLVDVPGTAWMCTATRDRPGISTVTQFVERVMTPKQ